MQDSKRRATAMISLRGVLAPVAILMAVTCLRAQEPAIAPPTAPAPATIAPHPIAIVPLDHKIPGFAADVTGGLEVGDGRAIIVASGAITSGAETTQVTLPYRGALRVCASTTVKLAVDSTVPASEAPGLMMAIDHGAVEMSFATGRNSDVLMTPDFRILISGPGSADVKVRLGQHGDTCVDNAAGTPSNRSSPLGWNAGANAPYVLVTSAFDAGDYRVQPGQRVLFERGSLHEVVDQEKESCGCPPSTAKGNEFPLAQSEGLAPTPPPAVIPNPNPAQAAVVPPLVYKPEDHTPQPAAKATPAPAPAAAETKPAAKKMVNKIGHFFRRLFGAE